MVTGCGLYLRSSLVVTSYLRPKPLQSLNLPHILVIADLGAWLRIARFGRHLCARFIQGIFTVLNCISQSSVPEFCSRPSCPFRHNLVSLALGVSPINLGLLQELCFSTPTSTLGLYPLLKLSSPLSEGGCFSALAIKAIRGTVTTRPFGLFLGRDDISIRA